jgi:hypothetical protein
VLTVHSHTLSPIYSGYPIACACAEDGVTTEECNLFQCACSCDVTSGVCDYNCCCDPDCSAEQKTRFAEVGCAAEGYSPDKTQLCYDSLELYKINPKLPLGGEPTTEASVGGALCVEKYNGATEIDYFTDTSVQSTDIFTVAAGKKDYYYGDSFQNSVRTTPTSLNDVLHPCRSPLLTIFHLYSFIFFTQNIRVHWTHHLTKVIALLPSLE